MSLKNRMGDTRSIVAKCIQKRVYDGSISEETLATLQRLRGDLESKTWRETNQCIYCGLEAVEKDHYGCAVVNKRANIYVDCPLNLVPSCRTCHRAGKDIRRKKPITIMEWWRGVGCRISKNHPRRRIKLHNAQHPENPIDEAQVYRRLVAFDEFHRQHALRIPIRMHKVMADGIEHLLHDMYNGTEKRVDHILECMRHTMYGMA